MLILEDFDGALAAGPAAGPAPKPPNPAGPAPVPPEPEPPEVAYERGYRAGWDDCEREAQQTRTAIGAELARNIQELGFTYHEARAHVLSGLEPFLRTLIAKILPRITEATCGAAILEEVQAVAETAADGPVTILVAPGSHDAVAGFLAESTALPFRLLAEPTLGEGQVCFRLGQHERQLDLGAVQDRILGRLAAFADQNQKVLKHG